MDKAQSLNSFWNSFGIPAYDENTVPEEIEMPYITYEISTDSLGNTLSLAASLWYRTTSWTAINQKADEIAKDLETERLPIQIDNGYVWIKKGSPFAQRMSEPDDAMVRRMLLNIEVEFLTQY